MFDNLPVPGRNDPCWCGSGRKYKKYHASSDERMEELYLQGEEVLPRSLLKTAADVSDSVQWEVQLVVTNDGYELLSW